MLTELKEPFPIDYIKGSVRGPLSAREFDMKQQRKAEEDIVRKGCLYNKEEENNIPNNKN